MKSFALKKLGRNGDHELDVQPFHILPLPPSEGRTIVNLTIQSENMISAYSDPESIPYQGSSMIVSP